jgi:DNA-directed RNA polymerase specialized sigma24 family protein
LCAGGPPVSNKTNHGGLRRILVRNLADQIKHHRTKGRNWQRQESLEALVDRSKTEMEEALGQSISTPSVKASKREQLVLLADALAQLPPLG